MSKLRCPGCGFTESGYGVWVRLQSKNLGCPQCHLIVSPPSPPQVVVETLTETSRLPHRQHTDDAGYDLHANEAMTINVGAIKLVRCGFKMAIPRGVVGFICPRSGMALKRGVTVLNGPGVIDPGFEDELGVVLINLGDRHFDVAVGDRIAQIVFIETAAVEVVAGRVGAYGDGGEDVAEAGGAEATTRRGGFGSSGGFERAKMEQSLVDAIVNQKKA